MIREHWDLKFIEGDSWEEIVNYINSEGKDYGWELRVPREPITPAQVSGYRNDGIPDTELPPKYMELWGTKSCLYHYGSTTPCWEEPAPIHLGFAGVSYVFNCAPHHLPYRNLYLIVLINDVI